MSVITHKTHQPVFNPIHFIIIFSAWGFALVISSCLFLWLGYLLDEMLGTSPIFMLGLLFMCIIGCFVEIFEEAAKIMKET